MDNYIDILHMIYINSIINKSLVILLEIDKGSEMYLHHIL